MEDFSGNPYHVMLDVVLQLGEAPPSTAWEDMSPTSI